MLQNSSLLILRFCLTGWTVASILFVLLLINQLYAGSFESMINDQLLLINFAMYHKFSFVTLGLSSICSAILWKIGQFSWRHRTGFLLTGVACLILLGDYWFVFQPLKQMLSPIGSPRPQTFHFLHQITESLNAAAVISGLVASLLILSPQPDCEQIS